ncbi:hypothetical protein Ddye_024962 [Dipteronia dyeriana]|uniref:Uncharacterized protein n=1 Tax=Dipteronia dyeriana TaxID=168575 RepID=A0AAD9WTG6_9ROSI|nr:hypothetical protein Ddye_024962 [Dipteronia dyeriana]
MASSCMSTCINDARVPAAIRPTYMNLYKWPESDAEFVRSRSSNGCQSIHTHKHTHAHARVVDSLSCRQMYLRSYTFSRKKERVHEKISRKCFGRVKKRVKKNAMKMKGKSCINKTRKKTSLLIKKIKSVVIRRAKETSCAVLFFMFSRLLSCTAKVDVADNDQHLHRHDNQGH